MHSLKKKIASVLFAVAYCLSSLSAVAQNSMDLDQVTEKIKAAQKVEELYPIKYNIDRYSNRADLSIEEQRKLNRTYIMLSAAFKSKSHFKNAADVYKDYLRLNEKYLKNYNDFCRDSILASHQQIKNSEVSRINELDVEIAQLNKTRDAVSGLKSKYYSAGGFATLAIIVLFLIIFITRNRAIRSTQINLTANHDKLLSTNTEVLNIKMKKGSLAFCRLISRDNIELIEKLIATSDESADKKSISKEVQSLSKAKVAFSEISS